ncbi:hypothetical protein GGR40_003856 [Novosphingobium gossypii]
MVFTLLAEVGAIAFHNKALIYDLLFRTASDTMQIIAADPKHLGARIGITAVLHTWSWALTHHPHVHMIVPGGGIALDGTRWVSARPAFLLPVRVLGVLFRRLFLTTARALRCRPASLLRQHGAIRRTARIPAPPVAGPQKTLGGLCQAAIRRARSGPRVAISNSHLLRFDEGGVAFRYKDYRRGGADRQQVMTRGADEFIRRFLLHDLPTGFHRIRHYGLLASGTRKDSLERARQLLAVAPPAVDDMPAEQSDVRPPRSCCGGRMIVIEILERRYQPREPPRFAASSKRQGS